MAAGACAAGRPVRSCGSADAGCRPAASSVPAALPPSPTSPVGPVSASSRGRPAVAAAAATAEASASGAVPALRSRWLRWVVAPSAWPLRPAGPRGSSGRLAMPGGLGRGAAACGGRVWAGLGWLAPAPAGAWAGAAVAAASAVCEACSGGGGLGLAGVWPGVGAGLARGAMTGRGIDLAAAALTRAARACWSARRRLSRRCSAWRRIRLAKELSPAKGAPGRGWDAGAGSALSWAGRVGRAVSMGCVGGRD